ncbi:MAG: histidine kinase, partial [Bacteroidota bacterium]
GLAMWLGVLPESERPVVALAHKLIFATAGALLTLGLRPLYQRLRRRRAPVPVIVAVSAVCAYAVSVVWTGATTAATRAFNTAVFGDAFGPVQSWWFFSGALFFSFIVVAWSALYFGISYDVAGRAERERTLRAEGLLHDARLQALRYQLNPHFLFNTLNALSTLIVEGDGHRAEQMVARLSDFLRLTLARGDVPEVSLADEVDFARRYLDIERVRFEDRLRVAYAIDADALDACVPPLLLQPLVENAVRHGVLPQEAGGTVRIEGHRARGESGRLCLRVVDDGLGPSGDAAPGGPAGGVGLANVRARLAATYGRDASLTIRRAEGGGCVAQIDLPYRRQREVPAGAPALDAPSPAESAL